MCPTYMSSYISHKFYEKHQLKMKVAKNLILISFIYIFQHKEKITLLSEKSYTCFVHILLVFILLCKINQESVINFNMDIYII